MAQTGQEVAADLAEEDRLRRARGVHRLLIHPAGSDKASLGETAPCVGACQPTTSLCKTAHTTPVIVYFTYENSAPFKIKTTVKMYMMDVFFKGRTTKHRVTRWSLITVNILLYSITVYFIMFYTMFWNTAFLLAAQQQLNSANGHKRNVIAVDTTDTITPKLHYLHCLSELGDALKAFIWWFIWYHISFAIEVATLGSGQQQRLSWS